MATIWRARPGPSGLVFLFGPDLLVLSVVMEGLPDSFGYGNALMQSEPTCWQQLFNASGLPVIWVNTFMALLLWEHVMEEANDCHNESPSLPYSWPCRLDKIIEPFKLLHHG